MSLMQPLEGITGLAQEQAIVPPLTRRHVADFGSKNSKTLGSLARRLSRMKRMWRLSSSGFLVCLLNCCIMWGQATAQITGIVRDQGGTVLPGVTVSVTQTDTGITQRVTTDRTGLFVLPNLAPGPYRLEAVLTGFRTVFVYRVNRYPPTRLEADRCCKVAVGRGGAEVRRKSASTVWRALGGNDPFGLCRGFLPGTSSWRRDSRFP